MSSQKLKIRAEFPQKFAGLFKPKRYKVYYGGRGGAKSWAIARALLIKAKDKKIRVLCTREFQKSIKDSVHKLLSDQIVALGYQNLFTITQTSIICHVTESEFIFEGLKMNITNVKSAEGIDIVWVEEAQTVSKTSWETLIPTIRKDNSEIWISFNPELEADDTYQRFVIKPPTDSIVTKVNYSDNPWFPKVLEQERLDLKAKDPDSYMNVWEGHCKTMLTGAVYMRELREAELAGQITNVPVDRSIPVHTFWDLGWADKVSIWFAQATGLEYHFVDFVQDNQRTIESFMKILQSKGYVYGTHYLPHDAGATNIAAGGRTVEKIMRGLHKDVIVLPRESVTDGINAARTIFPQCFFDKDKCSDGLQCLRRYRYEVDPDTGLFSKKPLHDEWSHGADAFRYAALSLRDKKKSGVSLKLSARRNLNLSPGDAGGSWMGN